MSVPFWLASAYSNGLHLPTYLLSVSTLRKGHLVGHRGAAERSRQGSGGQMGLGGEPGMHLSDLQGPQLPLAATAALRGQMSRPGKRLPGPGKEREGAAGTLTSMPPQCSLQSPAFPFCSQPPPQALEATSFPRPVAVAEESLGSHRTGVSELNIWKGETHGKWVGHSDLGSGVPGWPLDSVGLGKSCSLSRALCFL